MCYFESTELVLFMCYFNASLLDVSFRAVFWYQARTLRCHWHWTWEKPAHTWDTFLAFRLFTQSSLLVCLVFGELVWLPTTRCHTSCSVVPFEREMAGNKEGVAKSGSCHGPFSFPVGKSLAMLGPIWTPHWCVDTTATTLYNPVSWEFYVARSVSNMCMWHVANTLCVTHTIMLHTKYLNHLCVVFWQAQKIKQNIFGKHKK